mgnify:FL=1|tara:strand:+ start:3248 stop:3922 length:675 start_codon:yes stop_codon:yes gene_type:complete
MSDNESIIPEEEIPKIEKKVRKKKEMTEQMKEQLKIAREKAIQVKKALKGNPEARIEHYKEKIKKENERPKTKKELLKQAKEELEMEKLKVKEPEPVPEPEPEPEPEPVIKLVKEELPVDDELDENGLPKPPKQAIKKPIVDLSTDEAITEVAPPPVKQKKKVRYIYESDTDSEEERVVYVKKNTTKYVPRKEEIKVSQPITIPRTFGVTTNNRFGSYGMLGRR